MKFIKLIFLLLGVAMLWLTVRAVGVETISSKISELKWQLLPVLGVYLLVNIFFAVGWYYAFPKSLPQHIPLTDLYHIRVVGEALNAVVPWAASLGGEPIKADLLRTRRGLPLSEGYASILIVHTTFYIALILFVMGAVVTTYRTLPLTPVLQKIVLVFFVFLGVLTALLLVGLRSGLFKHIHNLGEFFKWWGNDSAEKRRRYLELDEEIKVFYGRNRQRFFLSTILNFAACFAGVLEVYLIAQVMGMSLSFGASWLIEALIQGLRIITFFIPASIGAQEGGIALIFLQFGFEKSLGVTFALIRRIREIIWIVIGLVTWVVIDKKWLSEKKGA